MMECRGEAKRRSEQCLPDSTDHWTSGAAVVSGGVLEVASEGSLGSGWLFGGVVFGGVS